jgi:uncharacterized peroxidase-related enzyme
MFLGEPPQTDQVQQAYSQDRDTDGYVNNLTRLWCWRPDVLEAYFQTRTLVLHESGLPDRDVALLVTATAAARSDSYCALAWGSRLARWSGEAAAAQVVAGSLTGLNDRESALLRWAHRVATDPNSTTAADVDHLRGVGLTDRQIFEVTAFVALRMAFSTVNDALGAEPDAQMAQAVPAPVRAAVSYGRTPAVNPSV